MIEKNCILSKLAQTKQAEDLVYYLTTLSR